MNSKRTGVRARRDKIPMDNFKTKKEKFLEMIIIEDDEEVIAAVVEFVRLLAGDKRL